MSQEPDDEGAFWYDKPTTPKRSQVLIQAPTPETQAPDDSELDSPVRPKFGSGYDDGYDFPGWADEKETGEESMSRA